MTNEEIEFLHEELISYVEDVGNGKDLDTLRAAVRIKINQLNALIDNAIDAEETLTYNALVHVCYQYYKLPYN
ncbi:MAG: hypothetical protein ACTHMI_13325 [Mucilaginibacter sp.]